MLKLVRAKPRVLKSLNLVCVINSNNKVYIYVCVYICILAELCTEVGSVWGEPAVP